MDKRPIRNPEMGDTSSRNEGDQRDFLTEYDSFDTQYDSTWEDDCPETPSSEFNIQWSRNARRNTYAAKDMQNFRKMIQDVNCDDAADDEELADVYNQRDRIPNLLFYQNRMKFHPDGVLIEKFHEKWYGDYSRLEGVHSYIQWLFPIQEKGMNYDSQPLTPEEIKLFRKDHSLKKRLLKSYKLMLDFYGIKLLDEETGKVCRAEHWEERFKNLDRNTHNNLRITRILKCLGILGFEHYQAPLVHFFLTETLVEGRLPRVKQSVLDYFMFSVLNTSERKELIRFAFEKFEPMEEFVWCPKRIQRRFLKEIKTRKAETPENNRDPSGSETCESEEIQKQNEEASNASSARNVPNDESRGVGKADTNPNLMMHNNQEDQQKQLNLNPDHTDTTTENQNTSNTDKSSEESEAQRQCSNNKPPITASRDNVEMDIDPSNQEDVCDPAATEKSVHHNSGEYSKYSEHTGFDGVSGPMSNKDPSESGPSEDKEGQPENGETPNSPTAQNVPNDESRGVGKADTNPNLMMHNNQEDQQKQLNLNPDHTDTTTENQNTSNTDKSSEESEAQRQCSNNKPPITASRDNVEMDIDPSNQEDVCDPAATEKSVHHNSGEYSKYSEHTGFDGVSGPMSNKDPSESGPSEDKEGQPENGETPNSPTAQNVPNDESRGVGKADTNPNLMMHNNQEDQQKQLSLNPDHTDTTTENQNTSNTDKSSEESEAQRQCSNNKPPITASRDNVEMDIDSPNQEDVCDPAATEKSVHHNSGEYSKHSEHTGFDGVSGPMSNKDPSESGPSEGKESQPENGETPNAPTAQNVQNDESRGVGKADTNPNLMMHNNQEDQQKQLSSNTGRPDTATENQNTSDTDKGSEESEAQRQCSITGSGDNAEKMSVNEGSENDESMDTEL